MAQVLDPTGRAVPKRQPTASDLIAGLNGKVMGIVSNHWQSMDAMAQTMEHLLRGTYGVRDVKLYGIPINHGMPAELLESITAECDGAIVGLAN